MKRLALLLVLAAVLGVVARRHPSTTATPTLRGQAMGCSWTLSWRGPAPPSLRHEVASVLEHWEQVLSQWRPGSDLSRHNHGEPATADLRRVLGLAERLREETGGAFDPRLLAPVHEAGFGPAGSGYDLSALGKGFACDRVGERLRELGVADFAFELGGEVLVGDGDWPVAVESPDGTPSRLLTLRNRAVATSGNYHQFRTSPDGLAGHILDPRNGRPVVRPPSSVTVLADECARADAWATALFVLGPGAAPAGAPEFTWSGR